MTDTLRKVEEGLGYRFSNRALLEEALTHRSYANEHPEVTSDNERLEFLGDAVVGVIVSEILVRGFPSADEGELTRRRATLVCEAGLCAIARVVHLPEALRLGKGEERTGGRDKPRLLSSALEACLGAALLDGGFSTAQEIGVRLFDRPLRAGGDEGDPKSLLQERTQAEGHGAPVYEVVGETGPDHARIFEVRVLIHGKPRGTGTGRTKLQAEQRAAAEALED
ncbi:MAG: ribonuclease III [Myxococcales bacterium]|nr:ribonuclease III [Myxococcales bacterium]